MQFGHDMDSTVPQRPLWPVPWKRSGHTPAEVIPADRVDEIKEQKKIALEEFMVLVSIDSAPINTPAALDGRRLRRDTTLVRDPWTSYNQAARQLGNVHHRGPRQRFYPGYYDLNMTGNVGKNGHELKPKTIHFL